MMAAGPLTEQSFIFFPERTLSAFPSDWGMAYEDVYIRCEDGVTLHGWFLPGRGKTALLFFHGNGGNISHRIEKIRLLCPPEISSLLIDYHGYGESQGVPSEESCYLGATASLDYLIKERHLDPGKVVLFGESLGGAVAVDLASRRKVGAVILESTFTHIGAVLGRFVPELESLLKNRFDSSSKIALLNVPLLILHGDEDELVPHELGRILFEKANEPKKFITLRGAHHNDTCEVGGKAYVDEVHRFIFRFVSEERQAGPSLKGASD